MSDEKIEYTMDQLKAQLDDMQKRLDILTAAHNAHVEQGHIHSLTDGQIVKPE